MKEKNPIEQLLDENNVENIVLYDSEDNELEFEQIAIIPLERTGLVYAILVPVKPMEGVEEGEGVLFSIDEESGMIELVRDEKIIDEVFEVYEKLHNEGNN